MGVRTGLEILFTLEGFSPFWFFLFFWGYREKKIVFFPLSTHPRATNYNSHVTLSTHNKSSETELKYSKGLQGVSSRENQGKVCLFFAQGGETGNRGEEPGGEKRLCMRLCACGMRTAVVFVWERWVAWGRRWRECEKNQH